ncbi:MAG TPA: hypothetical protein VK858_05070 [Longimicrobiales bacterium]|nr:hypothetical protein [Longimicrobiales bacterium]
MARARSFDARRFVTEAVSVTAGVLLAFGVDAWWSRVRQAGDVQGLVEAAARSYAAAGERFDQIHEALITTFAGYAPTSFLSSLRGVHDPTDFPVDRARLMTSEELEGAVGNLAVWADNLNRRVDRLLTLHDAVWAMP